MPSRRKNSDRRNPLASTGPNTLIYSVANQTEEYTVNRDDSEGTKAQPWVARYNGEVIGRADMRRLAFDIADAHQNKVTEEWNKKCEAEQEAAAKERAELALQPGLTVEELLADPEGGGVAIVSGDYAIDEAQLVRNGFFQQIALEPPVGHVLPATIDRHAFTMMLNRKVQSTGIQYSFIGSPRKAMREVRRLVQLIATGTVENGGAADSREAQRRLGWISETRG